MKKLACFSLFLYGLTLVGYAQKFNWQSMPEYPNSTVYGLSLYKDKMVICGEFTQIGSMPANFVALWDGQQYTAMGKGVYGKKYDYVSHALVYQNQLWVGGRFDSAGTIASKNLARWDGQQWLDVNQQPNGGIMDMQIYQDDLYIVGGFDSIGQMPANGIARWDGQQWHSLPDTNMFYYSLRSMAVYMNELIILGTIELFNDEMADGVVRWNGQQWMPFAPGHNYEGYEPVVWNNKLVISSRDKLYNGVPSTVLKQWDGQQWSTFSATTGKTGGALFNIDGTLYSGGNTWSHADTFTNVWQWDSTQKKWLDLGSGLTHYTTAIAKYQGVLYAGGTFNKAQGGYHNYLVRYTQNTGLNTPINQRFSVTLYPNPNQGTFTLEWPTHETLLQIKVTDITGKAVYQSYLPATQQGKFTISNLGLTDGVYFCEVKSKNGTAITKFIIAYP